MVGLVMLEYSFVYFIIHQHIILTMFWCVGSLRARIILNFVSLFHHLIRFLFVYALTWWMKNNLIVETLEERRKIEIRILYSLAWTIHQKTRQILSQWYSTSCEPHNRECVCILYTAKIYVNEHTRNGWIRFITFFFHETRKARLRWWWIRFFFFCYFRKSFECVAKQYKILLLKVIPL